MGFSPVTQWAPERSKAHLLKVPNAELDHGGIGTQPPKKHGTICLQAKSLVDGAWLVFS